MARVILNNETYNAATDGSEISGSTGTEQVNVFAGVTDLEVASNVERVDLPGDIADFTFSSFGNSLTIRDGNGDIVAQISGADGKEVVFGDGALDVAFDAGTGVLTVGGETVGGTAAAITPAASEIDTGTTSETAGGGTVTPPPASGTELTADADDLDGTAGADNFTAPLNVAAAETLQTFDRIDGLGGTDSLSATLEGGDDFNSGELATTVQNVENFFLRPLDAEVVDFSDVEAVEQIWSDRALDDLDATNVENFVTVGVIGGEETAAGVPDSTFTVDYSGVVADAEDDDGRLTQAVALNGASAVLEISEGAAALAPTNNTTLEFALTGDSNIDLGTLLLQATGLDTITTSGSGSIDLDIADTANAGANALVGDLTITLGGGDDTLRKDGSDLDADDDIDMGAGEDTLALTGIAADTDVAALDLSVVTGLENLILVDALTLGGAATLNLDTLDSVTFEGLVTGASNILTVDSDASDVTMTFEAGTATLLLETEETISSLTLETEADLDIDGVTNVAGTDSDTLTSIAIVDTDGDDANALSHDIVLGGANELDGLTMIDLSDAGQDDDDITIDASAAGFEGPVTIMVGDADLDYTADAANKREVFQFAGEDINVIGLTDFVVTGAGNGDKLDFSMFSGVTGLGDLAIVESASTNDWEISAADGEFDGTITLVGLGSGAGDVEQSTLEANIFIF